MSLGDTMLGGAVLRLNQKRRKAIENLIPRDRDNYAVGSQIMDEIMGRKRQRMDLARSSKNSYQQSEYGFGYREWSTEMRKALAEGKMQGQFAGKDMTFPIASPQDVKAAWASANRAENPKLVMKNIIAIAKQYGWENGLPKVVRERLRKGESGLPD